MHRNPPFSIEVRSCTQDAQTRDGRRIESLSSFPAYRTIAAPLMGLLCSKAFATKRAPIKRDGAQEKQAFVQMKTALSSPTKRVSGLGPFVHADDACVRGRCWSCSTGSDDRRRDIPHLFRKSQVFPERCQARTGGKGMLAYIIGKRVFPDVPSWLLVYPNNRLLRADLTAQEPRSKPVTSSLGFQLMEYDVVLQWNRKGYSIVPSMYFPACRRTTGFPLPTLTSPSREISPETHRVMWAL